MSRHRISIFEHKHPYFSSEDPVEKIERQKLERRLQESGAILPVLVQVEDFDELALHADEIAYIDSEHAWKLDSTFGGREGLRPLPGVRTIPVEAPLLAPSEADRLVSETSILSTNIRVA